MCEHEWMQVHEQAIIGGTFPVGWKCLLCGKFVGQSDIGPAGLGGHISTKVELYGVHGGLIKTASGKRSRAQIYDSATGKLEYLDTPV